MGCAPRCRKNAPRACTVKTFVGSLGWESGHHNPIRARCSPKWVYPANVEFSEMRDKWVWRNFADFAPLIADLPSGKYWAIYARTGGRFTDGEMATNSDSAEGWDVCADLLAHHEHLSIPVMRL